MPDPCPASGALCAATRGLSYDDLLFAVSNHRMESPLPVSPVVMGFLPFDDGELAPRYLMEGPDLLVMRLGVVSRTVPTAAVRRLMKSRQQDYERAHGAQMPAQHARQLRGDCITELLASAHASERDSLVFYQPSTGLMFVPEKGATQIQAVVQALNRFVPALAIKGLRPRPGVGELIKGWLTHDVFPDGVTPGRGLRMVTSKGATVSFRNAEMGAPEVLAHFDLDSEVQDIDLAVKIPQGTVTFAFSVNGMVRRLRVGDKVNAEGLAGLSLLLKQMDAYAQAVFPGLRVIYRAIASEPV